MRVVIFLTVAFAIVFAATSASDGVLSLNPESSVAETMYDLGLPKPSHFRENLSAEEIERGRQLVWMGTTSNPPQGKTSRPISRFFTCVTCHNTVREDPILTEVNSEARLSYAMEKRIPYLQGSTFWGIVNRTSWYNDDYVLKYGELVDKAKNSLEESTQLCALVCSQGRTLEQWELDAIIAYYWSLEMNLGDLGLDDPEKLAQLAALPDTSSLAQIQALFMPKSPATFSHPPTDKDAGYGLVGDASRGQGIYELGCQHCHRQGGGSDVILDDFRSTFRWLERNIIADSPLSIYEIVRHGTYSEAGHRPYMPHYTQEKLSDQQLEDLRAFVEQRSKGK